MSTSKMLVCGAALLCSIAPFSARLVAAESSPIRAAGVDEPTVDKVLSDAVDAVGGREAVDAIKTLHAVFEMDFQGQKIITDTSWSRDGGRLSKMTVPGMGEILQGTDGTFAWRKTPAGYAALSGLEEEQFKSQAEMYMMVLEPEHLAKEEAKSVEVAGTETFDGKDCNRLHFVSKSENSGEGDLFFDASTGLFLGTRQSQDTPRGRQTTTLTLTDWQETSGVKFFRSVGIQTGGGMEMPPMVLKVTTLEVNSLPPETFALPDEVKKLAEAKKNPEAAGPEIKLSDLPADQQTQATNMIDGIKKGGSPQAVAQSITSLEQAAQHAQEPQKKMLDYVLQELKKYQKTLDGGK